MNKLKLAASTVLFLALGAQCSMAATVYDIQAGGLKAQYFFSTTLGTFYDLRGTSPAGLIIGVTENGTPLGSVLIGEPGGALFGNTTLNALSGLDFIQLDLVPGSQVFNGTNLTMTLLPLAVPSPPSHCSRCSPTPNSPSR